MIMQKNPILVWLASCCAMIFLMALIGAITRLTESGLSITRWEPISGAIPPLNENNWNHAFDLYKQSPQYRAINQGMDLEAFKGIFFWEWLHRLWGRLIGLVYALPLAFFWLKGMIPAGYKKPLLFALLLGGMQGFVGWFMVQSGLVEGMASVSAYRLALHLGMALLIYAFLLWLIFRLKGFAPSATALNAPGIRWHALIALSFVCITMIWGAFTAGLDAGKIYNTFPLMNGQLLPADALVQNPVWINFLENPAGVQFVHRWLAISTFVIVMALAIRYHKLGAPRVAVAIGFSAAAQVMLGIGTLLSGVDIALAVIHQANAIILLSTTLAALYLAVTPARA